MHAEASLASYHHLVSDHSIQAWIEDCIAQYAGHHAHPLILEHDHDLDVAMCSAAAPSTPSKRRRDEDTGDVDVDATPRPLSSVGSLPSRPSLHYSESSSSGRSSGRASGRSSPSKKERSLRQTKDYPVRRILLSGPGNDVARLPASVLQLILELKSIGLGEAAVIPDLFYDTMCDENGILNQPKARWFIRADGEERDLRYRDNRLRTIWRGSIKCTEECEHEAGWNDTVHALLLDEAVRDVSSVSRRNITTARILPAYRDPDPDLGETKIDYGLFLVDLLRSNQPALQAALNLRIPFLHMDLPNGPRTPLAVSIETKSLRAGVTDGSTQLANWARAHFRHLEAVARTAPVLGSLSVQGGADVSQAEMEPGPPAVAPRALPVLPLVSVLGNSWSIAFAQRTEGLTLIWGDVVLGDTNTLEGCYFVYHCLRRVAAWVDTDLRSWWEEVSESKSGGR